MVAPDALDEEAAPSEPDRQDVDGVEEDGDRQRWSSRLVFIFAAIGSAVGLGNVWRFPYYVTKFGGGTFLIPYTICLVFIGMPILLMELSLGQVFQGGDVEAFGALNPRCRGIGLMSILSTFLIITYYAVVNTWSLCYMFTSFGKLPWETVPEAWDFFLWDFLGYQTIKPAGDIHGTKWDGSWQILMGMIATWFVIYICVFQGVRSAGEAVKFTMPFPVLILIILMFAAVTKEGAGDGLDQYLGQWEKEGFNTQPDGSNVWTAATAQVFFTLSVTMGVMTAYSSFNPRNQNIVMDEKYISLGDFFIAFISGFTIYSLLGHTVHNCKNEPDGTDLAALYGVADAASCEDLYGGVSIGLAFIMFPYGLSTIPGSNFWCVSFFLMLFLLGIDSAFSMIEAITTVISDMELAKRLKWTKSGLTEKTCLFCFCIGTVYTMDTGLDNFDIVDHYVNSYNLLCVGFLEAYATAWVYKIEEQTARVGEKCVYVYNSLCMFALLVAITVGFGTTQLERNAPESRNTWNGGALGVTDAGIAGSFIGLGLWMVAIIVGYTLADAPADQNAPSQILWGMMGWPGPDSLRKHVNRQHYPDWQPNVYGDEITALCSWTTIPIYWGFFLKYLIPSLLMAMLANGIREDYYTPYGGFTEAENGLGLAGFIIGIALFITPVLCPIVFMSNKTAHDFEGWDLMVALGMDPRRSRWLGFDPALGNYDAGAVQDEKDYGANDDGLSKRDPDDVQMTSFDDNTVGADFAE